MIAPTNDNSLHPVEAPPPSYDVATTETSGAGRSTGAPSVGPGSPYTTGSAKINGAHISKGEPRPLKQPQPPVMSPPPPVPAQTVYYYTNPTTGVNLSSFYPPDHPRSLCLMYGHVPYHTHGILGILAAVFFFPIGVALCMVDRRSTCARCGEVLEEGISA